MKKETAPKFQDLMSPEIKQAFEEIQKEKREGSYKSPPKTAEDCHSMEDLARYVFKLARLDGEYQMLIAGPSLQRWVWSGHTFTDRFVKVVAEVAPRLPDRDALKEFRLVATRVTSAAVERLRTALPRSTVTVYADEESNKDWQLSQASYMGPK